MNTKRRFPDNIRPSAVTTIMPFGHGEGSNPNYEKNVAASPKAHGDTTACCCYCGKFTGTDKQFAFLANVGIFIDIKDDNGMDDLGMYPVGSDCAKLLKKHGVKLYTSDFVEI